MLVAVISDIHSNVRALDAALEAIDRDGPDAIWCLGDIVGYGPKPDECCRIVESRAAICLAGNHDLGVRGDVDIDHFAPDAAAAALWTRGVLSKQAEAFLGRLRPSAEADGVQLFHASPRNPVWEYVLTDQAAAAALEDTSAPIVLVGHSHVPLTVKTEGGELAGGHAPAGTEIDLGAARWLLNPGSVGQPRDGDWRAAFAVFDSTDRVVTFCRVPYNLKQAQDRILTANLPQRLATRLAAGR